MRVGRIKVLGDEFDKPERAACLKMAGETTDRLTTPAPQDNKQRVRAPIRTVRPIAQPVFFEAWLREGEQAVSAAWEGLQAGLAQLSAEARAWLQREAPWLMHTGRWVVDAHTQAYRWVNTQGQVITQWTLVRLRAAWQDIVTQTDLTWAQLQRIDWGQLLMDVVKGVGVVVLVVTGVAVALALGYALIVALLAIVSMVAQLGPAAAAAIGGAGLVAAGAR